MRRLGWGDTPDPRTQGLVPLPSLASQSKTACALEKALKLQALYARQHEVLSELTRSLIFNWEGRET